jgi:hypothetical protein
MKREIKRLSCAVLIALVVVLNKKLGLELSVGELLLAISGFLGELGYDSAGAILEDYYSSFADKVSSDSDEAEE